MTTTFSKMEAIGRFIQSHMHYPTYYWAHSLQSTVIRNSIVNSLKAAKFDTANISANFVYESPTINELSLAVYGIIDPSSYSGSDKIERKVAEMQGYVDKYSTNLPLHKPTSSSAPLSDVVVLTGSTGALGTTLLAQLVQKDSVSKIYALNRKSSKSLKKRQEESLVERGYDPAIASSPKVVLLEGDAGQDLLGLSKGNYNEVSIADLMHCVKKHYLPANLLRFVPAQPRSSILASCRSSLIRIRC